VSGARRDANGRVTVPLDPLPYQMRVSKRGLELIKESEGSRLAPYVPPGSNNSGVTIGYGYDMGGRTAKQAEAELMRAGIDQPTANRLAKAATLRGAAAKTFIRNLESPIKITKAQSVRLLEIELEKHMNSVARAVIVPLTQGQFDALVSFHYNRPRSVIHSMAPLINRGDFEGAAKEFDKVRYVRKRDKNGKLVAKVSRGLADRRDKEKDILAFIPFAHVNLSSRMC
jgi:GH24 family phage-related lysozyme (muramidase)